jgi:RimJ/RimL family protein N-acetyltransferase
VLDEAVVSLREVVRSDLPLHFEQQADPESSALASVAPRDREAFDAHWERILADEDVVVRTVLADGAVAGSALSFTRDGKRLVGYWIDRRYWGRGIATSALAQLLDELVTERPLFAEVATRNPASRRVLEKQGFRRVAEEPRDDVVVWVMRLD